MDFDSMKYAELRSIAKELGLKANMKADKLLKAIKQHYQQVNTEEEQGKKQENGVSAVEEAEHALQDSPQEDEEAKGEVSSSTVFVNTRRGKGNGTKRKISDTAVVTEEEAKVPPSAAEVDAKEPVSVEPSERRASKKRKVSSTKDSDQTEAEPPREDQTTDSQQQPDKKAPKVSKGGRIPRYQGSQQKNKPLLKPVTPNFKKLHEAHFNKMESIDSYVQRKNKQMESYKNSVKELKKLAEKTKLQQPESKPQVRVNPSRTSMFSPAPLTNKAAEERRRHTLLSASKAPINKPAVKEVVPFRPSVLSTRRINVRFSEATHDNEYKKSLMKTPARMSPCVASSTPLKPAADGGKTKPAAASATKTPATFVFTGNTSTSTTPGTQKKPSFDLKASLSRPLSYKPHTGKLKPFGDTKENPAANKSLISNSHQKNYKQHQVQTRMDRRVKQVEERKQKKESMLGARRGLVMM